MNKAIIPFVFGAAMLLTGCANHEHEHTHEHGAHGGNALGPLAYTLYTDKTELFLEFKPLQTGKECRFAAHFTALGDTFKPFTEGTIALTLEVNGSRVSVTANKPQVPGIFKLRLTPGAAGDARLIFDIKTKFFTDQIIIDSVKVYANKKMALAAQPEESGGANITYLKEQAWKAAFANAPVTKQTFSEIIKTSGQILAAPGDEMMITAMAGGIVLFSGNKTIIGSEVRAGTRLFTIAGGDITEGNIDAAYRKAKANYDKAKADYDRASELVKDKIISEKEHWQARTDFENAKTAFNTIAKNYSSDGQAVLSERSGFVKNIFVTEGQFVEPGTPLAMISKNKKLILRANVSQKYFNRLPFITSANFRTTESDQFTGTQDLNGKIVSYGKSASANSPFIPISFEIDNTGNIISGSVAEVYLKSRPVHDALVVPVSSLIEEQGNFFVYVQVGGESFQKREVALGARDGMNVQLLSGVSEGERVVTKGAYQIKLATVSGTLPAHGHEH